MGSTLGDRQFFFLLFDPELTTAGRNLMDGRFATFGCETKTVFYFNSFSEIEIVGSWNLLDNEIDWNKSSNLMDGRFATFACL